MFVDREDAGRRLAQALKGRGLERPLIVGIPRGGVVIAAEIARELGGELDLVLSRKLRAPDQPELAIGAISESGEVYMNAHDANMPGLSLDYLRRERNYQLNEIHRRRRMFRAVRPQVPARGRCVIVCDDGIATGATMIAALQTIRSQQPKRLVAAVPVAAPSRSEEVAQWCDETVCLIAIQYFFTVGQFYEDFRPIDDKEVQALLRPDRRLEPAASG